MCHSASLITCRLKWFILFSFICGSNSWKAVGKSTMQAAVCPITNLRTTLSSTLYSVVSSLCPPLCSLLPQSPSWRGLWRNSTVDKVSTCSCRQMEPLMEQRRRTMVTVSFTPLYWCMDSTYFSIMHPLYLLSALCYTMHYNWGYTTYIHLAVCQDCFRFVIKPFLPLNLS